MTAISREIARKQPAEIVQVSPELEPQAQVNPAAKLLLRLIAVLFLLGAGFQIWCAATGYRV